MTRARSLATAVAILVAGSGPARAGWQLVWSDEFDGAGIDTNKWTFDIGNGNNGWGNWERQYYTSRTNNAFVADGLLHIVAWKESYSGFPYTSARLKTQGRFSKTFGRFEFRARLPRGLGFWPALWMLGTNITSVGWPSCGEIDVMEAKGSWTNTVQGTIHYADTAGNHTYHTKIYTLPLPGDSITNFHTYAIEWASNSIKWLVDGVTVHTWTSWASAAGPYPAPFDRDFFIIMNLAIGGSYLGNPSDSEIDAGTVFPGEMQVDYVRVYEYVATPPEPPVGLAAAPGNAKVFLSWLPSFGATGYKVKRAVAGGRPYSTVATTTTNLYTDNTATNCATYFYVVSATNALGESANSTEALVTLGAFAFAVNSGGGSTMQFLADTNFTGGTQAAPVTTTIDTNGLVGPAPQTVYQTERYGNFTYTFSGLMPGTTYLVRLHFAETYWSSAGKRRFNVFINGTQVLTNFDIVAEAGAPNKAVIEEFTPTANPSGQIVIRFATVLDNAKCSGIEVVLPRPTPPEHVCAVPGDSVVTLSWTASPNADSYNVKRALASGGPYVNVCSGLTATNFIDSGLTNGTTYYYVVSAVRAGCESTNSVEVTATPVCAAPPAPVAGYNSPVYAGMTLYLTASSIPGASYFWTGPNGFSSTNQNPVIHNAREDAAGRYSVVAIINGCASEPGIVDVVIHPPVRLSFQLGADRFVLDWPFGTLLTASNIAGPWQPVEEAVRSYTGTVSAPQQFFRVKLQ